VKGNEKKNSNNPRVTEKNLRALAPKKPRRKTSRGRGKKEETRVRGTAPYVGEFPEARGEPTEESKRGFWGKMQVNGEKDE